MKEHITPKILFLSAWYPNRYDEMWGLFVKNHAIASSKYAKVAVLYVHPVDSNLKKNIEIEISHEPILTIRVYYKNASKYHFPIISVLCKLYLYIKAYKAGFKEIEKLFGSFDLIHANILTRTALFAVYKKLSKGKKYIITEHWSRYMPNNDSYKGFLRKVMTRFAVKQAEAVTVVAESLKSAVIHHQLKNDNYFIVPNVVDDELFSLSVEPNNLIKNILHVSCFEDKSKNISGILKVVKKIQTYRTDFKLTLVGDGIDKAKLENYAKELQFIPNTIEFKGLLVGKDLIEQYHAASFMVLFSNYETFGVVLAESLVCGNPVIATRVGGIPEFVNESNGILIETKDEMALEKAIVNMLDSFKLYDKEAIRKESVLKFSPQAVGKQFYSLYSDIINKSK